MLTREQKKKLVIELYEKCATWKEIHDETHLSYRDISKIIQEYDPKKRKLSPRTMALNLFAEGKPS